MLKPHPRCTVRMAWPCGDASQGQLQGTWGTDGLCGPGRTGTVIGLLDSVVVLWVDGLLELTGGHCQVLYEHVGARLPLLGCGSPSGKDPSWSPAAALLGVGGSGFVGTLEAWPSLGWRGRGGCKQPWKPGPGGRVASSWHSSPTSRKPLLRWMCL